MSCFMAHGWQSERCRSLLEERADLDGECRALANLELPWCDGGTAADGQPVDLREVEPPKALLKRINHSFRNLAKL